MNYHKKSLISKPAKFGIETTDAITPLEICGISAHLPVAVSYVTDLTYPRSASDSIVSVDERLGKLSSD